MSEYLLILMALAAITGCTHAYIRVKSSKGLFNSPWQTLTFFEFMYIVGLVWDRVAVERGHWSFNPEMVTGYFLGLPVEEHLFFLVVPYFAVVAAQIIRSPKN